ncbi:unnamed protein product [Amoebophrya sp. A120]|nr:unnamed protein product [Amoebophrya sp. A120]|eukprot:GSA120T00010707001.1
MSALLLDEASLIDLLSPHAAALEEYVPYSFPAYFIALAGAGLVRSACCGLVSKAKGGEDGAPSSKISLVSQPIQFAHNVFLALQSAFLMYVIVLLYKDTQILIEKNGNKDPSFYTVMTQSEMRRQSQIFPVALVAFLASKLYETLDTVILILNGKPLLMLHVWHHATTYLAFYTGLFTGAGFWIGMLNSFIHVVMYLYYAKIPGMAKIAKYITSMQIFHLFGGFVWNLITFSQYYDEDSIDGAAAGQISKKTSSYRPFTCALAGPTSQSGKTLASKPFWYDSVFVRPIDQATTSCLLTYSALNAFLCFSYFFLFLAFFSKKYHKNGSIWTLFGVPKVVCNVVFKLQSVFLPKMVNQYLQDQGLLVRGSGESSISKNREGISTTISNESSSVMNPSKSTTLLEQTDAEFLNVAKAPEMKKQK